MTIERAIEVFVHGFAFTRSFTQPYLTEQLQPGVWALHDATRVRGDYRSEEYVTYGSSAAVVDALARRHTRGRFRICVIRANTEPDVPIRAAFRTLGYRLMTIEPFMLHHLADISPLPEPYPIEQVTTEARAKLLAKAARSRQILPEQRKAEPAPMRQYMALDEGAPIGWGSSVVIGDCAWCQSMFVAPTHRRQGVARALLTRILADDKATGLQANILLASHAGAKLYPTVGYETLGELLLFVPPKQ